MKQFFAVAFSCLFFIAQPVISQEIITKNKTDNVAFQKEEMKEKKAYKDSIFLKMVNDADNYPVYNGTDLGLTYSPKKSVFKLWSPPAKSVNLFFYDQGTLIGIAYLNTI